MNSTSSSQNDPRAESLRARSRRQFIKTSGTALGGALTLNFSVPEKMMAANSDTLRVGLIGCGGRGRGAALQALNADPNTILTAVADVFPEPVDAAISGLKQAHPTRVQVDPAHRCVGLDGYQKVLDSGVDVVLLAAPPGFRPAHLKASVAARKHIFSEKPMATDAPGIRMVLEAVEESRRQKLCLVSGFCWRYDYARREFFQRVHDGALGELRAIYGTYYTGPVKPMPPASERKPGMTDLEWQLRNWYNFVWICGDSLVEQAVHSVDKMAWAMNDVPPLRAVAVGGRQIPSHGGNIFDHFEVNYEYADGTRGFLACRQQTGCYNENADYLLGAKGIGTIGVRPRPEIKGQTEWRYGGPPNDMYQTEHDELFAAIRAGKIVNDGTWMTHSTMMAILGRMAAYTGQLVTWDQALQSEERLVPDPLDWNMKLDVPPIARPGSTKLV